MSTKKTSTAKATENGGSFVEKEKKNAECS
jgi:hypothetical protein